MLLALATCGYKVKEFLLFSEIRLKASRAKKLLQKKAMEKEKRKAEALASGIDWLSDDSDDEPQVIGLLLCTHF